MPNTILILDREDAENFLQAAERPVGKLFALNPASAEPLRAAAIEYDEPSNRTLYWADARAIASAEKRREWLKQQIMGRFRK